MMKSQASKKSRSRVVKKQSQPRLTDVEKAIEEIRDRRRKLWKEFGGSSARIAEYAQKVLAEREAERTKAARRRKSA